jgi:ribonuclease BN (tRNA processing enzyme)
VLGSGGPELPDKRASSSNAVPEGATGVERQLHMPPSVIGQIAQQAHVKRLVLSRRMLRTLAKEAQSLSGIRKNFSGSRCLCKRSRLLPCTLKL